MYTINILSQNGDFNKGYVAKYSSYDEPVLTFNKSEKLMLSNLKDAEAYQFLYTDNFNYAKINTTTKIR